ncbi:MAG TPA: exopolysaccharide biosynthesis polyprenyl glycosylphosphotransferase [Blastocatellia bacterium]|nr:exopolysaccharide biosynthesis polyprenyl glycosylphosphotransferase [Blastocatellia bacterium]
MNDPISGGDKAAKFDLTFPYFSRTSEIQGYAQGFKYLRRCFWNAAALGVGDALAVGLAMILAGMARKIWMGDAMIPSWCWLTIVAWWILAAGQRLLPAWGIGSVEELRRLVLLLMGVFSGEAVILVLTKESDRISRIIMLGAFLLSVMLVPLGRAITKRWLISRGVWGVPTVVYADPETAAAVIQALREQQGAGYLPIGVFTDTINALEFQIEGLPVLGSSDLTTSRAPVAILATRGLTCRRVIELLDGPLASYRHVIVQPDLFDVQSLWVRVSNLGGVPALEMSLNLLDPVARWSKHFLELMLVILTAPLWGLLCLLLGALIWLEDRANPFFYQERIGKNGRTFRTRKFRTMVPRAEEVLRKRLAEDPQLAAEWEANFKLRHDPRVTRLGRLLRRASLDELPQLINVLKGEMSLVGPRPLPAYHHDQLTAQVKNLRERVRPGLTGLWQVSGRSQAGMEGIEKWDAYYVRNWSVWLDIIILARTVRAVSGGRGAF